MADWSAFSIKLGEFIASSMEATDEHYEEHPPDEDIDVVAMIYIVHTSDGVIHFKVKDGDNEQPSIKEAVHLIGTVLGFLPRLYEEEE